MVTRRRIGTALVVLTSVMAAACGEYAHTNPFDPKTDTRITISGPDTLWAIGEVAEYTATVTPAMIEGTDVVWGPLVGAGSFDVIVPTGHGQYRAASVGEAPVVAIVGRHEATKSVVVRQRPARVFFFCTGQSCTTFAAGPPGVTRALTVGQYDANGYPLGGTQPRASITYTSGNPTIVAIAPGTGTPLGVSIQTVATGSAFVYAQLGSWKDSVLVTVSPP